MAGAGAGADQGPGAPQTPGEAGPGGPRPGSDWAGLPEDLLVKVAGTLVAQTEAGSAARLKERGYGEQYIQREMAKRKRGGNCLVVFARVCKPWRKAQLKVGGRLRTRVRSDVILPGQVALVKWALAEGCPRDDGYYTMASAAAQYGHFEVVKWLIQEQGFAMDRWVMGCAARSGNLELVRYLRGEGCDWSAWTCQCAAGAGRLGVLQWVRTGDPCPWDWTTCEAAVAYGHVEVLRWARENGCPWNAATRDRAAAKLGYTDDFGNLV